jgi:tetratricopeptide (TPR) repeat protein
MKLRPTIFISGVSSEFGSFRDAVEVEVQKKDCFPLNQPSFRTDYRTIEEILRRNIGEADAVIHIVGFRFGLEPKDRPLGKPRRSYTQMEYDIARELEKPVFVFLSADANVRDSEEQPEDAEAVDLQLAHRQALQSSNNIRYTFRNKNELCNLVAGIPLLATADFRVDISRIDKYAPAELIGRDQELVLLDNTWLRVRRAESGRPHILTCIALGGEGKTSLVAKWLAALAYENWPGCDSAFAWSFYSQGTRDQVAASSDLFLKEAITFFGNEDDKQFAASSAGAYEKGQRLARIIGKRRSLLILDGVEPLQYSPTSPTRSELKDAGLIALLKGLAVSSQGLCIITTRYSIPNLKAYWQTTAPEFELQRLSPEAGVHLLKTLGVRGTPQEIETLVEDVKGHALTLNLLGTYLRDAHAGDIRRRDLVKFEEADAEEQSGHAFRVMEAYERAFQHEGETGKRALAILRLLGLFDRPASVDCLGALLNKPPIAGLTERLVLLSEAQQSLTFKRLEDAKLLTVNREPSGALISLDAHPLLREYFNRQLRTQQPDAWRAGHKRLYERLCATTSDKLQPTLENLQPLYHAVTHGCHAGLKQETCDEVYFARIIRQREFYPTRKLGAFASDLGAIACFFETPWSQVSRSLTEADRAWLLSIAAFDLHALGRLTEALEPILASMKMYVEQENWREASREASNLSELDLTLGRVADALSNSEKALTYADRSSDGFQKVARRAVYASVLHQAGRRREAAEQFKEAERVQATVFSGHTFLYGLSGFKYCELLLAVAERAAWQRTLQYLSAVSPADLSMTKLPKARQRGESSSTSAPFETLRAVTERAAKTLQLGQAKNFSLLGIAVDHLTLGRAGLYHTLLSASGILRRINNPGVKAELDSAVNGLRRASTMHHLPRGLLTRAWLQFLSNEHAGGGSALEDLEEAWEIAERGPMRLHMADIHLYRARLFFREKEYPWESPEADLAAARKLIEQCGYWRRKEELEDAERVILKNPCKQSALIRG